MRGAACNAKSDYVCWNLVKIGPSECTVDEAVTKTVAKGWWGRCISCSEAAMTTQLRSFGVEESAYEQAIHAFSGGFLHSGRACGLLSGSALAAGVLARTRFSDQRARIHATLAATIGLARSHPALSGSVNCQTITETELTTWRGRLSYLMRGKAAHCGRLHVEWTSRAHRLIEESFRQAVDTPVSRCDNCAVATLGKCASAVGIPAEDVSIVAGLAGGLGLLGNVCGALAAGVFALGATHYIARSNAPRDSRARGAVAELSSAARKGPPGELHRSFCGRFGSDQCMKIVGRRFENVDDHARFIAEGGCATIVDFVAQRVRVRCGAPPR